MVQFAASQGNTFSGERLCVARRNPFNNKALRPFALLLSVGKCYPALNHARGRSRGTEVALPGVKPPCISYERVGRRRRVRSTLETRAQLLPLLSHLAGSSN